MMNSSEDHHLSPLGKELALVLDAKGDALVLHPERWAAWRSEIPSVREPAALAEEVLALALRVRRTVPDSEPVIEQFCDAAAELLSIAEAAADPDTHRAKAASFRALLGEAETKSAPKFAAKAPDGSFSIRSLGPRLQAPRRRKR